MRASIASMNTRILGARNLRSAAVATVLLHSGASIGIGVSEIAYLTACLAGVALLAGGIRNSGLS